jgi:hypothetical protein
MIPKPAQYLLRFDDLCPTIKRADWEQYTKLMEEFSIRPILAVVPDNRDSDLDSSPADPNFWEKLRQMQAAGATIAVHGYHHLCSSRGESLLKLHSKTEFAGVDFETQRDWIRTGFRLLDEKGLHPRLWVGPRHGFDRNTLEALRSLGVEYISDGFARVPHRRYSLTWIPQQLWGPAVKSKGLWTICIHPNAAVSSDVEQLRRFLENHGDQVTSFDRVVKEFAARPLGFRESIYQRMALGRVQGRYARRRAQGVLLDICRGFGGPALRLIVQQAKIEFLPNIENSIEAETLDHAAPRPRAH